MTQRPQLRRILVVDDMADARESIALLLRLMFPTVTVVSADNATADVLLNREDQPWCLVVADSRMNEKTPSRTVAARRAGYREFAHKYVVLTTCLEQDDHALAVLLKPVEVRELLLAIAAAFVIGNAPANTAEA